MPMTGIMLRASTAHASGRDASSRKCCESGGGAICRSALELVFSGGFAISADKSESLFSLLRQVRLMQRHQNGHREINPAAPLNVLSRERQRQDKRNDSNADRNTPPGYLLECH